MCETVTKRRKKKLGPPGKKTGLRMGELLEHPILELGVVGLAEPVDQSGGSAGLVPNPGARSLEPAFSSSCQSAT